MSKNPRRNPKLKLVPKAPGLEVLQGQVRGFCTTKEAKKALLAHGLPEKAIYLDCGTEETLGACLNSYRERAGWLILAQDLRIFGRKRKEMANRTDALEKAGIRLLDITHPTDQTYAAMLQRAAVMAHNWFPRDRKMHRIAAIKGGLHKGLAAQRQRDEMAPSWLIDRIVDCHQIPWSLKEKLLHPHFAKATLSRHYGVKAALRRA